MDNYQQRVWWPVLLVCLLWILPLAPGNASAADLFESEVVVPNQSPAERSNAFHTALAEVLVRVAGRNNVLASDPARSLLDDPGKLVQQYRYYTRPDSQPPVLLMWVRFDEASIRQGLQQQGLSYWGKERPDTLVWLAVEDRGRRYVVAAGDDSDVRQQIELAARQRGVPVVFPLMDLEDQSRARFTDIWGGFFDNVLQASERYSPQAVLIGRLNRSVSGGWSSRWHLQIGGKPTAWTDSRNDLALLSQQGVNDTADILASQFAVATGGIAGSDRVIVEISGVDSLADYARINDYLGALTSVANMQLTQVNGSSLQYSLQLNGSLQDLTRTVAIGSVLEPAMGEMPGNFRIRQ
jgi:hypothetical protein